MYVFKKTKQVKKMKKEEEKRATSKNNNTKTESFNYVPPILIFCS